jgi:hypothetical protein
VIQALKARPALKVQLVPKVQLDLLALLVLTVTSSQLAPTSVRTPQLRPWGTSTTTPTATSIRSQVLAPTPTSAHGKARLVLRVLKGPLALLVRLALKVRLAHRVLQVLQVLTVLLEP